MDFPHVTLVIQYRCRGLTLVQWEQCRGHGGRRKDLSAIGVILMEKSMTSSDDDDEKLSAQSPKSEDPGLLDLIQTEACQEAVVDVWLENPPCKKSPLCGCCSNCNPDLCLSANFTWVMEDPQPRKTGSRIATSDVQKKIMLRWKLQGWRLRIWKEDWKDAWPSYGLESLVSDTDLEEITWHAQTISTIDDLDSVAQIPHLYELGDSLLQAMKDILFQVIGAWANENRNTDTSSAETMVIFFSFVGRNGKRVGEWWNVRRVFGKRCKFFT